LYVQNVVANGHRCGHLLRTCTGTVTLTSVIPAAPPDRAIVSPAVSDGAPAHRTRRSREELRGIVLDAGREVLLSDGLGTGAEHLSFTRGLSPVAVTRSIRVTNASVIGRIWDNQEDFQLDVVDSVANIQGDKEVTVIVKVLTEVLGRVDVSTPELRCASLGELIRVACGTYMEVPLTSTAAIQVALVTYGAANQTSAGDNPLIQSFCGPTNA
jgi:hypothetical protein